MPSIHKYKNSDQSVADRNDSENEYDEGIEYLIIQEDTARILTRREAL